jgi:inhibitor of cysteine peptidase
MNYRMLAALVITAAALTGCSKGTDPAAKPGEKSGEPHTETIQISYDDLQKDKQISRSTTLAVGDFLQMSLASNPSTGFSWDEKLLISDPKVLAQTGHEALAPKENKPGAPGSEVWMVQAMAPGNSTVSTSYGRPWEGGEKDAWVFSVNVTVK